MRVARRVQITGRVQGVFYRSWTHEQAEQLGIAGWVRNCDDGSVEVHVEGNDQAVRQLFRRLAKGPTNATVASLFAEPVEPEDCVSFEVRP